MEVRSQRHAVGGRCWEPGARQGAEPDRLTPAADLVAASRQTLPAPLPRAEAGRQTLPAPLPRAEASRQTLPAPLPRAEAGLPSASAPVVALEPAGRLRHQPIARLVVRPLAWLSQDTLQVRTLIRARVRYVAPETVGRSPQFDYPFSLLTPLLLNNAYLPLRVASGQARPDRQDATSAPPVGSPADPAADPDALKVAVNRDGPVAISGEQLAAAGWELAGLNTSRLTLTMAGQAQAFIVEDGGDGHFDPSDRLVFYAQVMSGRYTRDNVYWLSQAGTARRPEERPAHPDGSAEATSFAKTLHFEEDSRIIWSLTPDQGSDRWMWGNELTAPAWVTHTLNVDNVAAEPRPATLLLALQGYTDDPAVSPDHHTRLWWNGRMVLETFADGLGVHLFRTVLPPGLLVDGTNQFGLQSLGDTGAAVDAVFLNWIELRYPAGYRATTDRIEFRAPRAGRFTFSLHGFRSPQITVLDVTDPAAPVRLTGIEVPESAAGTYGARFTDTATDATSYMAFAPNGALPPARILPNRPSTLRSSSNGADYIVIAHPDLAAAVAPLAEHRAGQGLRVQTVLVDDIYDEFSAGVFDPRAIRSFLQHAFHHWQPPPPTYVLLVGESNLDYRGGMRAGPANFVPSVQLDAPSDPQLTMYTSDLWFAALHDGDVLPDVLIGRLSASRAADVTTMVSKTLAYERQGFDQEWRRRLLLVADDDGAPAFEAASERLAALVPTEHQVLRFYAARYPRDRSLPVDIRAAVEQGVVALNFSGHGNVSLWSPWPGGGYIFQNSDIAALLNAERMPIFTTGSCMTGWIDHPLKPVSMTEQWLLNPHGGGVVAWAASGFAAISDEEALLVPFYRGLYDGRASPVGALVAAASAEAFARGRGYADVIRQYVLLGDPALVVSAVPPRATPTPTAPQPKARAYLPLAASGQEGIGPP